MGRAHHGLLLFLVNDPGTLSFTTMPELPEVETIRRGLIPLCVGKRLHRLRIGGAYRIIGPYAERRQEAIKLLQGSEISDISRRAKRLIFHTDGKLALIFQLGMTGKFLITDPEPARRKHTHVTLELDDGLKLRFNDIRRFGKLCFMEQSCGLEVAMLDAGMGKLGPEPFDMTPTQFRHILQAQRPIKALLLDQSRIAGLGNIYADEALHAARIHPTTPAAKISANKAAELLKTIVEVLNLSIEHGGTTFSDFNNPYGDVGEFRKLLKAYGREGEPCYRCSQAIERLILIGRSSHFCPHCQREATG